MVRRLTTLVSGLTLAMLFLLAPIASAQATTGGGYAALGDSVAAGVGLPLASTADDPRCGRSAQAYPYQVAQTLQLPLNHIACSGATVGDLFTRQRLDGPDIQAQLKTAFANGKPSVISITAGANDMHWTEFLGKCLTDTCGTPSDQATFSALRDVLAAKYYIALSDIQVRSHWHNTPQVVLTGYYNPLSLACAAALPQLTTDELTWIASAVNDLNATVEQAAQSFSFASYAPVDFSGHDICSGSSWVQGPSDAAPFHPNTAGQQAMATAVLSKLGH